MMLCDDIKMPRRLKGPQTPARSTSKGTVLPRTGMFWGVQAPQAHSPVVVGELAATPSNETQIRGWREPHSYLVEQTMVTESPTFQQKLAYFGINLNSILLGSYDAIGVQQSTTVGYLQHTATPFVRGADAALAIIPSLDEPTESAYQRWQDALAPLRTSSNAILEAIQTQLNQGISLPGQSRHVGLAAVSWLQRILDLTRPTILRMGGVPESTFYAWQKSPQSAVRASSVSRLLQLQAQLGLLAQVQGLDAAKAWALSRGHLSRLQGDETEFMDVLGEAEESLKATTRVQPRPRMQIDDYTSDEERRTETASEFPTWPQATKLPDELKE